MKKHISIILGILLFAATACKKPGQHIISFELPQDNYIIGLASPISLNPTETTVYLSDYFPLMPAFDSISTHHAISYSLSDNSEELTLKIIGNELPLLTALNVYFGKDKQSILLKKSEMITHKLTFDPKRVEYESVKMKGEMNNWNEESAILEYKDGVWTIEIDMEAGSYQYIFVADGKELTDPTNPETVSNGMGGFNSVLRVGEDKEIEKPHLATTSHKAHTATIRVDGNADKLFVLYDNFLGDTTFYTRNNDYYTIFIPEVLKEKERSFIRVYAYNEAGISNDLKIPLHFGEVLSDTAQIKRTDFKAAILYNAFIDRFHNANPDNDRPTPDPDIHPKANYHGGDIQGVTEKIKDGYFQELGINTVWISPVVKNPEGAYGKYPEPETKFSAYHGYWPISFTEIDDRLGTPQELKELVRIAHENDMNVLLDFVANHVHEEHPFYQANKDWATELYLPDGTLNTERWDSHRLTTWFDTFLPTLDLSRPEVYEMLTDSAVYWIKEYNLDGFRHDATKHIPEIFWRTLTHKLKTEIIIPENRPLYQIGETYGSPQLISSYVGTGQLCAQFDFNMYDALVRVLAGGDSFKNAAETLEKSLKYYGHNHIMGNITGNQDRGRFISFASGALDLAEDTKHAGWNREIGVDDPVGYKKAAVLTAIIASLPGLPVIYYGDEFGSPGGNDPDNRRMMRFDDLNEKELELRETTSKLLHFRQSSLPLIYGETRIIHANEKSLIFERNYFGNKVYIAANNTDEETKLEFATNLDSKNAKTFLGSKLKFGKNTLSLNLPANSFEIIYN